MATNGTSIATEPRLGEEIFGVQTDHGTPVVPLDKPSARRRIPDNRPPDAAYPRSGDADLSETSDDFALAPLVEKIAFGIARGLIEPMKELENHIATEAWKVGDMVERQLSPLLQSSLIELSSFVREQRSTNLAVQDLLQQLTAADASLRETDARQVAELDTLRAEAREFSSLIERRIDTSTASLQESNARQSSDLEALRTEARALSSAVSERIDVTVAALKETDERQAADLAALQVETRASNRSIEERIDSLCRDVGLEQEEVVAIKGTLSSSGSRIDALVERLDRQADAVRLMHTTYSQRENELEQLVDGLARLRAFPKTLPTDGL
jgi:chromosome segregation ATPase